MEPVDLLVSQGLERKGGQESSGTSFKFSVTEAAKPSLLLSICFVLQPKLEGSLPVCLWAKV